MIEVRVQQGLFHPAWGPYMNAHFLVPKMNWKNCSILSTGSVNGCTLDDARIQPTVEEFTEDFTKLPIWSLIIFHSGYDQMMLHENTLKYMAFQTTQGMNRPTRLVQGVINSVSAFVTVSWKIRNAHQGSITEMILDNIEMNGPKSQHEAEEVIGLHGVSRFVIVHLHNLHIVFANVERSGSTMAGGKSDWCWNGVRRVRLVCGDARRWPQASKFKIVWHWPKCKNRTKYRVFLKLYTLYQI